MTGQAVVESTFLLHRRGRVLVLGERFDGVIPQEGFVETSVGIMAYSGPEFLDGPDHLSRLAVVVPDAALAGRLPAGERVVFFERDQS